MQPIQLISAIAPRATNAGEYMTKPRSAIMEALDGGSDVHVNDQECTRPIIWACLSEESPNHAKPGGTPGDNSRKTR